uniref:Uncharacterized protein n=1 Tax=Bradyrhizobium ottawaense TaxID=931866 RepID=A0A2U8PGJ0_9BRAD|nr:hypothetical protein CIT37_35675 [Bradyrhizobium ottawaense]
MLWGSGVTEHEFYRGLAQRVRGIAELAEPFIRRRLLKLAEWYDAKGPSAINSHCIAALKLRANPSRRTAYNSSQTAGERRMGSSRYRLNMFTAKGAPISAEQRQTSAASR